MTVGRYGNVGAISIYLTMVDADGVVLDKLVQAVGVVASGGEHLRDSIVIARVVADGGAQHDRPG